MASGDWIDSTYEHDERTVVLPRDRRPASRGGAGPVVLFIVAALALIAGGMHRFHPHVDRAPVQVEAVTPPLPPSPSATNPSQASIAPAASSAAPTPKIRKRRARGDASRTALERLQRAQLERAQ